MKIPETIKTYGVIAILIVLSFWVASRFVPPPPPSQITIATGSNKGDYYRYAQTYKEALIKDGVEVRILETAGSKENIALLNAEKADVAFIQGGLSNEENSQNIQALSSLYYEPLWVFTRGQKRYDDIKDLKNKTIAIGTQGSGTYSLSEQLLNMNGIKDTATLSELSGEKAAQALKAGNIDAAFFIAGAHSPLIKDLLKDDNIQLLSFRHVDAYIRLLPFLSKVTLNEGVIDIARNIPDRDIELISPVAQLTAHKNFNGALKTLLVSKAMDIHGQPDIFSDKGTFPTLSYIDFPVAEEAERYFKYGPSFLQRILPFWLADMISRMIVMLIPMLGIMLPLVKLASPTYRWRTRSKIYRWYKNLRKLEDDAKEEEANTNEVIEALDVIEREVKKTQVPLSYADELYNLRLHIKMIRERMIERYLKTH